MGCDIHILTEKQLPNGTWESLDNSEVQDEGTDDEYFDVTHRISTDRNYALFGLMSAGVRCEFDFSFVSKDKFPDDASQLAKDYNEQWDCDGHSHSWLTLNEIKHKLVEIGLADSEVPQHAIDELIEIKNDLEGIRLENDLSDDQVRILFLFDN
jgi:hypothetical protein